ncbi:MAG: UDP-N-acetylmuramoyl-L-alanine--D-glutamate ligase [Kineothrix sp.]
MDIYNKKVLVIGTGLSGMGAVKLLGRLGSIPVLYDENEKLTEAEVRSRLPEGVSAEIFIGALPESLREEIVLLVPSPGVPVDTELVESFRRKGIPVWGEMEMGWRFARGRLAAITGTNGKTTTTALVGQIMRAYYKEVHVVGNIGHPYTAEALETTEEGVTVAEASSFQLETTENFRPNVSAILNITPDHLDRHHTMENYAAAKERIALCQTGEDVCVLNYGDSRLRDFAARCPARVVFFSSAERLRQGMYLEGEDICMADENGSRRLMNIHDMHLVGLCNVENVMAAIAVSLYMGVPMEIILDTVRKFKAVEHRIEFVGTKNGVDYYNDSKGTNPDAAIQGIRAMSKPTVLIAGGYDKGNEYDEWIEAFEGKVKCLVLIGQTAEKIEACARKHGVGNILRAETFEEALLASTAAAAGGDAVLLSPACASWGMFPNYEVRGNLFKDYVNGL